MNTMWICPKCEHVYSYDSHYNAYRCTKCGNILTEDDGKKENQMYVVTQDGQKLYVDTTDVKDDDMMPFQQTVGLYTDNTILKDVWILELNKRDFFARSRDFELEFVKELYYDHEPTKEEILWAMSTYGCTRGDIVFIRKGYELDTEYEDE